MGRAAGLPIKEPRRESRVAVQAAVIVGRAETRCAIHCLEKHHHGGESPKDTEAIVACYCRANDEIRLLSMVNKNSHKRECYNRAVFAGSEGWLERIDFSLVGCRKLASGHW